MMSEPIKGSLNGWLKIIVAAAIPLVPYTIAAIWWAAGIQAEQKRISMEIETNRAERIAMVTALGVRVSEASRTNAIQDTTYQEIQRQIADIKATVNRIEVRIDAIQRRP